jgi:hypothetical protein
MLSWMAVHGLFRCYCAHQNRLDSGSCFLLTVTFLMRTGRVYVTPGGPPARVLSTHREHPSTAGV